MNNDMFCKHCEKSIADNAKFCASCGNAVSASVAEASKQAVVEKNLKGLGGWLVLVILGLFVSVSFQAHGAYESVTMFTDGTVEFLSDPSSEVYIPGYGGLLKFEFIAEIIFLTAGIYLIYLFFKRSRKFPKYYVPFLMISTIYVILDYALLSSVSVSGEIQQVINDTLLEQDEKIGRVIIGALIWGLYMKKSKRVKATFVEE